MDYMCGMALSEKSSHQAGSSNEDTSISTEITLESQRLTVQPELHEVEQDNFVMDSDREATEHCNVLEFINTKSDLCLDEYNHPLPILNQITSLNQKECFITQPDSSSDDEMRVGSGPSSNKSCGKNNKYKCEFCNKSFPKIGNLKTHLRTHTGEKPFKCPTCDKSFAHSGTLKDHIRIHTGEKPYKCTVCGNSFAKASTLARHNRTHTGERPHACNLCEKSFADIGTLMKHRKTHTGEKRYECMQCGKVFAQRFNLQQHQRIHCGDKPHQCKVCGKKFTHTSALRSHQLTFGHTQPDTTDEASHIGDQSDDGQPSGDQPASPYFDHKFQPISSIDGGDKPHILTSQNLEDHGTEVKYEPHENNDEPYIRTPNQWSQESEGTDGRCGSSEEEHDISMRDTEHNVADDTNCIPLSSTKSNACAEEPNDTLPVFSQITSFEQDITSGIDHPTVINKDRQGTRGTLRNELSDHEKNTCQFCDKSFTTSWYHKVHMKVHTGENLFQCTYCQKEFSDRSYLRRHIQTHTGDKPHECSVCGKSFVFKGDLTKHQRMHTGEKPYRCSVCGVKFTQSGSLRSHQRKHSEAERAAAAGDDLGEAYCVDDNSSPFAEKLCESFIDDKSNKVNHSGKPSPRTFTPAQGKQEKQKSVNHEVSGKEHVINTSVGDGIAVTDTENREENSACLPVLNQITSLNQETTHDDWTDEDADVETEPLNKQSVSKRYKCEICNKAFAHSWYLQIHVRIHTGEKPYKCTYCEKSFTDKSFFTRHIRTHTGEKPHKCDVCGKSFISKGDLDRHIRIHSGVKPYSCKDCGKSFTQNSSLKEHQRVHTGERPFECQVCGKRFRQQSSFRSHRSVHAKTQTTGDECNRVVDQRDILSDKCLRQQSRSDQAHTSAPSQSKPEKEATDVKCELQEEEELMNSESSTTGSHSNDTLPVLNQITLEDTNLSTKAAKIAEEESESSQTNKKKFKCEFCNKSVTTSWYLQTHMKIHTGEKPFKCSTCGKAFIDKSYLTRHIRTHTGERRYKCQECGKAFTDTGTLARHVRIHSGEKPYSCDECGKSFTQKGSLAMHQRLHTGEKPYECPVCMKLFTDGSTLNRHKRIHTGEKPYECKVCGRLFSDRGNLERHGRTHT